MGWVLLLASNLLGYGLMAIDKKRARRGEWRISERSLFLCATCFGSFGVYAGMHMFRHKTKHRSFQIEIPLLMTIQVWMILKLYTKALLG